MLVKPSGQSDYVFFFQAEDGIRAADVTGVKTCALPISRHGVDRANAPWLAEERPRRRRQGAATGDRRAGRARPRSAPLDGEAARQALGGGAAAAGRGAR